VNGLFLSKQDEPWKQLAVVAKAINLKVAERGDLVDAADYEAAFKPYIRQFMNDAKIQAARRISGEILTDYMKELQQEAITIAREIAGQEMPAL
jgi:hypothetical protein